MKARKRRKSVAVDFVYTAVAEGGSGMYEHTKFLGTAFSEDELLKLMEADRRGPCPGEQYELTRRKIGKKKTEYMTAWACHGIKHDLETGKWR